MCPIRSTASLGRRFFYGFAVLVCRQKGPSIADKPGFLSAKPPLERGSKRKIRARKHRPAMVLALLLGMRMEKADRQSLKGVFFLPCFGA